MRVITGIARGRKLVTLEGEEIRPTADKVKEAIFSSIQFDIEARSVLDLFAGSGALGIEALSRGAARATFVDISKKSIGVVKANLDTCALSENAKILNNDGISFLKTTTDKFDIVLLDPPYHKGLCEKALANVERVLNDGGVVVCETAYDEELPDAFGKYELVKNTKYSKTRVYIYRYSVDE